MKHWFETGQLPSDDAVNFLSPGEETDRWHNLAAHMTMNDLHIKVRTLAEALQLAFEAGKREAEAKR